MVVSLQLTREQLDRLQRLADSQGRSAEDVANEAVVVYLDESMKAALLQDVLDEEIPRYSEALRRLGE